MEQAGLSNNLISVGKMKDVMSQHYAELKIFKWNACFKIKAKYILLLFTFQQLLLQRSAMEIFTATTSLNFCG